jgi:hypothetical protein
MNTIKRHLLLATVLAFLCGCGDRLILQTRTVRKPQLRDVHRVAVIDFEGDYGQAIADLVTMNLMRADYNVVERERISDIIREAQVGKAGFMELSDAERARIFGKILNADVILTGQVIRQVIPYYQKKGDDRLVYESATLELTGRAFDARTGEQLWTAVVNGTATATTGKRLKVMDYINEPCRELVYSFANPTYTDVAKVYEGPQIDELRAARGF